MSSVVTSRAGIPHARRIVVKVGSSSVSGENVGQIGALVDALAAAHGRGSEVILVSSGAIATGIPYLNLDARPTDLATQQAAAAVGQNVLIYRYQDALRPFAIVAGQVLLTAGDLENATHRSNARRAMERLLGLRILPIVNENDTVATNEIRFGDNDRLSALVAQLVGADALVLLSDIDGLYDSDPRKGNARFIPEVAAQGDLDGVIAGGGSSLGTGGMASKLSSALLAADAGVPVLLAAASDAAAALGDASVGTVFAPRSERMSARKFWVRHAAESHGALTLDDGAVRAVVKQRRSLLPAGITEVSGRFHGGDVVDLRGLDGHTVARGVVAYEASELANMIGRSTPDLPAELRRPAVHADDLVAT